MSKPPVWVVEMKDAEEWVLWTSCKTRARALEILTSIRGKYEKYFTVRVAKYVRVEPTAKRRRRK